MSLEVRAMKHMEPEQHVRRVDSAIRRIDCAQADSCAAKQRTGPAPCVHTCIACKVLLLPANRSLCMLCLGKVCWRWGRAES